MLTRPICLPSRFIRDVDFRPSQRAGLASNCNVKSAAKFVCLTAEIMVGGFMLTGIAAAQTSSAAASSAMISAESETGVKAVEPVKTNSEGGAAIVADPASLLPDLPPVPHANATLIGGTIERLDRVRDKLTVRVFGGNRFEAFFDPRTKIYNGKNPAAVTDLHQGERVYLETILDGDLIFARTIRVNTAPATGQSQGTILRIKPDGSEMSIRDAISPNPIRVRLDSATRVVQQDRPTPSSTLIPGSLVAVTFNSGSSGDVAREIRILALPGSEYTFAGPVTYLDLRSGLLVIDSTTDHKTYEIYLDSSAPLQDNLRVGAVVNVVAEFKGSRYAAQTVTVTSEGEASSQSPH
jgi:hypothetical protein